MVTCFRPVGRLSLISVITFAAISVAGACSPAAYPGPMESIAVGYTPTEAAGLVYVAEDRGFFTANGVNLVSKYYDTGAASFEALLKNEVDIAGSAEVPFITQVFAKQEISLYATFGRFEYTYLFGRKDRGIETVANLRGKRIGLPRGTMAEFYLGRFLQMNGLRLGDLVLVATAPPAAVEAIMSGALDGVVVWNPFANQIRQQMADSVTLLRLQSHQPTYATASARNDWIASHKAVLSRSLKAVLQAEQYLIEHPAEARAIVQKRMNYDSAHMDTAWSENQYSLSLPQSLIATMEDQARWMLSSGLTSAKQVPDFLDYVYVDALKEIRPEAVNIVR